MIDRTNSNRRCFRMQELLLLLGMAAGLTTTTMSCLESSAPTVSPDSVKAEMQRILTLEDRLTSIGEFSAFLLGLPKTPEYAQLVVGAYDRALVDRGDIELVLIVEWWVPFDAEGALEWSRETWVAEHPRISYAVMRSLARLDPQRAVDEFNLKSRSGADVFASTLQPAIVGWQESGKPGLIDFIQSLPSAKLQQKALGTYTRLQVLKLGPERAMAWADEITEQESETFRRLVLQRVAATLTELEPAVAAVWVEKLIRDGESETILRRVARRWSATDPVAALTWLDRFERSDHQQQAVAQAFSRWLNRAPEEAETWLRSQGEAVGTSLAPATHHLIKSRADWSTRHPEDEIDWQDYLELALEIEDPGKRWGAVTRLGRVWISREQDAAIAWINQHEIPEGYRAKLFAAIPQKANQQRRALGAPGA